MSRPLPQPALHIVLVAPEIPWNTGNAGRTCLAIGAQLHLVRPLGFSLAAHQIRRAGLDYWPHVKPQVWDGWDAFEAAMPELGTPFFFTAEAQRSLWEISFSGPAVLVFGSESAGLPADLRTRFQAQQVAIPMQPGPVRSLNLSTSVAVAGYEVLRRWGSSSGSAGSGATSSQVRLTKTPWV